MIPMTAKITTGDPEEWAVDDMLESALDSILSEPTISVIGKPERTKILEAADHLINGDRAADYGDALTMHRRIAAGWSEILEVSVTPDKVALCMAWLKISRLVNSPGHRDSYVDLVAYGALAGEMNKRNSSKGE